MRQSDAALKEEPSFSRMAKQPLQTDQLSAEDRALKSFLETIGVRVVFTDESLWHSDGLRMYVPLLCKGPISMSSESTRKLWRAGALFLRYPTGDNVPAFPSHIYLVDDKSYDLHSISGNQRKETRRALRKCTVAKIPMALLFRDGLDLIKDTYERQGRVCDQNTIEAWKKYFRAAADNPAFEAWGAFVGTELAAYRVDFTYRGGFYGEALFNRRDLLKYQVMNALMFISTKAAIGRPEIDHVSYGMRGLVGESAALNRFKESMGYRKVLVAERIEVAPWLRPSFNMGLSHVVHAVAGKYYNKSAKARRICGMIQTYLKQRKNCLEQLSDPR
jgi:hypothetical protein